MRRIGWVRNWGRGTGNEERVGVRARLMARLCLEPGAVWAPCAHFDSEMALHLGRVRVGVRGGVRVRVRG